MELQEPHLAHHGILGQKWGVRRYQNPDGSLTPAGEKRYSEGSEKKTLKDRWNALNPKTKTAIKVGVAIAGTALAVYGARKFSAAVYDPSRNANFDAETGFVKKEARNPYSMLSDAFDARDDVMETNPKAAANRPWYLNNCSHCSVAYDLRRRGFNVTAAPGMGETQATVDKFYINGEKKIVSPALEGSFTQNAGTKSTKWTEMKQRYHELVDAKSLAELHPDRFEAAQRAHAENIVNTCESFGPNVRGNLSFKLATGGGHNIAFETNSSGKVKFIDSQLPNILHTDATGGKGSFYYDAIICKNNPFSSVDITRTDNATPNYQFLRKAKIVSNPKVYNPKATDTIHLGVSAVGAVIGTSAATSAVKDTRSRKRSSNSNTRNDNKLIRKYKAQHPNTQLSDDQILAYLRGQ